MPTLSNEYANAMNDAGTALLNSGDIRFHTSGHAEVATVGLAATAFGASVAGVATIGATTADTTAAGGTIAHAHGRKSDGTEVIQFTTAVGSGDIDMTSLTVAVNDTVDIDAGGTITMPLS